MYQVSILQNESITKPIASYKIMDSRYIVHFLSGFKQPVSKIIFIGSGPWANFIIKMDKLMGVN